jgi:hypothetical protein
MTGVIAPGALTRPFRRMPAGKHDDQMSLISSIGDIWSLIDESQCSGHGERHRALGTDAALSAGKAESVTRFFADWWHLATHQCNLVTPQGAGRPDGHTFVKSVHTLVKSVHTPVKSATHQ